MKEIEPTGTYHPSEDSLNEYLDEALSLKERAEIDAHLAVCPQCALKIDRLKAVFASLELIADVDFHGDLSASVLDAIQPQVKISGILKWGTLTQILVAFLVIFASAPLLFTVIGSFIGNSLNIYSSLLLEIWVDIQTHLGTPMFLFQMNWSHWRSLWQTPSLPDVLQVLIWPVFLLSVLLFFVGNGLLLRRFARNGFQ